MKKLNRITAASLAGFLATELWAADCPQWRAPSPDGTSNEKGLRESWPNDGPKLPWQVKDLGRGYATPSVPGRHLYVMTHKGIEKESVNALEAKDAGQALLTRLGEVGNPDHRPSLVAPKSSAEQLYVNVRTGNDANPGTKSQPLKSLQEAAKRVNANNQQEATTILLSEGVYPLTETVLFSNNKYTLQNRLVIRAAIMPDDPDWNPQRMPTLVMVVPTIATADGEEAKGVDIETSHVTVEGLRFSGGPAYYYIDGQHNRRLYPIWRDGKNLDDLLVTQCLFTGDVDLLPVRVATIANGHGLVLDHCVFYHCQNPVVFWDAKGGTSHHNAMRYCLVYGAYYSGVWTTQNTAEDFEFHHNIIAGCGTGWIKEGDQHYSISDCIFTGNTYLAGSGNDPTGGQKPNHFDFLQMTNVQTGGTIEIEKDQSKRNYLQVKEGSFGSTLKAGLFKK